jgi:type II secretory pathway pseudopilin PulG
MQLEFQSQDIVSIPSHSTSETRGMTFVELIVTISVFTVVSIALLGLIQSFYKNNTYLIEGTTALASARRGVTQAVTDIREASYGDDGTYLIATAGTSTLTIYSDIDQDTYVERVTYKLISGTLYRTITQATGTPAVYSSATTATTTVTADVRNTTATPVFTYYDSAGVQLSTTSPAIPSITAIQVQLLVDLNPNRAPNVFTLVEKATLRNVDKN